MILSLKLIAYFNYFIILNQVSTDNSISSYMQVHTVLPALCPPNEGYVLHFNTRHHIDSSIIILCDWFLMQTAVSHEMNILDELITVAVLNICIIQTSQYISKVKPSPSEEGWASEKTPGT